VNAGEFKRAAGMCPSEFDCIAYNRRRFDRSRATTIEDGRYIYFAGGEDVRVRAAPAYSDQVDEKFGRDGLIGKTVAVTVPRLFAAKRGPIEVGVTRVDDIRVYAGICRVLRLCRGGTLVQGSCTAR